MGVAQELKQGSFCIYAQWTCFISLFSMSFYGGASDIVNVSQVLVTKKLISLLVLGSAGAFNAAYYQTDTRYVGLGALILAVIMFYLELPFFGSSFKPE